MIDFVISVVVLFFMNKRIAFITIILFIIYMTLAKKISKKIDSYIIQTQEANAKLSENLIDTLSNVKNIKMTNDYKRHSTRLSAALEKYSQIYLHQCHLLIFHTETTSFFTGLSNLIILFICGYAIIGKNMTIGAYSALAGYVTRILSNARTFANLNVIFKPIFISLHRANEFMGMDEEPNATRVIQGDVENIRADRVSFSYGEEDAQTKLVLSNIDFCITKGEKFIIEGNNGTGKSTLVDLLLGIYEPTEGTIYYNDIPLSELDKTVLRNKVAVMSQQGYLFEGTIMENILLYSKSQSMSEVIDKIKQLEMEDSILRFKNGLEGMVTPGGSNLSSGQKQLLILLRTVLSGRDILILDEPTSNMDIDLKRQVARMLEKQLFSNIVIIISHDDIFLSVKNRLVLKKAGEFNSI